MRRLVYNVSRCVVQINPLLSTVGYAVVQLVEALRYKLEGRAFHSRWCHLIFSLT